VTLAEFQRAAARTINPKLSDRDRLIDAAAGLAEEAGEVLSLVRKHALQGGELSRDRMREELGDTLWCLSVAAQCAGLTLDEVAAANVVKLAKRYPGA
jgi:NTP pyrophosphatase (non-canonical NTP hydrolase)